MLDPETREGMLRIVSAYWAAQVTTDDFQGLASGKEIGHRIADYVDDRTAALLDSDFNTRRQYKAPGKVMTRSMGDIWIHSGGIFNPVNVKAGELGKNGQPNMVSLKKLLRALLLRQIDSYYLLIVKMELTKQQVKVYLVDILDYLDYVSFDSGPGQIMLREQQFYAAADAGMEPTALSMDQKVERLFGLLEAADRRLMENRERVAADIRELRHIYNASADRVIDQTGLNLL